MPVQRELLNALRRPPHLLVLHHSGKFGFEGSCASNFLEVQPNRQGNSSESCFFASSVQPVVGAAQARANNVGLTQFQGSVPDMSANVPAKHVTIQRSKRSGVRVGAWGR